MESHQDIHKHYEENSVINGCIAIERAAASIYNTFMQVFPEEKKFWQSLFDDEIEHLTFLTDAEHFGIFKEPQTRVFPPSIKVIEKSITFAEGIMQRIKYSSISLENALNMSLKLEESMVEAFANKSIASILATDDESFNQKLLTYERIHIDKIREMMIKKGFLKLS